MTATDMAAGTTYTCPPIPISFGGSAIDLDLGLNAIRLDTLGLSDPNGKPLDFFTAATCAFSFAVLAPPPSGKRNSVSISPNTFVLNNYVSALPGTGNYIMNGYTIPVVLRPPNYPDGKIGGPRDVPGQSCEKENEPPFFLQGHGYMSDDPSKKQSSFAVLKIWAPTITEAQKFIEGLTSAPSPFELNVGGQVWTLVYNGYRYHKNFNDAGFCTLTKPSEALLLPMFEFFATS